MRVLVTGGAGFIGSAVCRRLARMSDCELLNLDKLTYAANLDSLAGLAEEQGYHFVQGDICDGPLLTKMFAEFRPDAVLHLAAESHVDRSIMTPDVFVQTNVVGTHVLLEAALSYWETLPREARVAFRFMHVSTDEVFGSLGEAGRFNEATAYNPSSPYSASKAAADHLVRAWGHTYGLPVIISNCSNNYGPYQFPEKLIPTVILNALEGRSVDVYGDGANVRDWLHVDDHVDALLRMLKAGQPARTYAVGGDAERTNFTVVEDICRLLDEMVPGATPHRELIQFVDDRPGHDRRYAVDGSRIKLELGWAPAHTFDAGLRETVRWYLDHEAWWRPLRQKRHAGDRLGLKRVV
ncbi:MAG: dTDP-glucose 4,6-dehydratase [Hyphomonadaceae bacterium]